MWYIISIGLPIFTLIVYYVLRILSDCLANFYTCMYLLLCKHTPYIANHLFQPFRSLSLTQPLRFRLPSGGGGCRDRMHPYDLGMSYNVYNVICLQLVGQFGYIVSAIYMAVETYRWRKWVKTRTSYNRKTSIT